MSDAKMSRNRPTVHQHIMRCFHQGTGARLSASEVTELGFDDAIATAAAVDDEVLADLKKKQEQGE